MLSQNRDKLWPLLTQPANSISACLCFTSFGDGEQGITTGKELYLACFYARVPEEGAGMKEIRVFFIPSMAFRPCYPSLHADQGAESFGE